MEQTATPCALVVDDDQKIVMHVCDILEDAGFGFFEAGSGDEAAMLLEGQAGMIVLLFTDVEMPGRLNGFQLAQIVARRWPHIEIVVASGRIAPSPGDMPEKATFIGKPFSAQMVHDHLRETLPDAKLPEPLRKSS